MTMTVGGTSGLVFPDASTQNTAATGFGFKNRIINGAMQIDQRNAGASVTPTSDAYVLDRWKAIMTAASKYSVQQNAGSVTPPAGFSSYLGVTSLAATSLSASDYYVIGQRIEGFNVSDFAWGTASATPITISFWVRSSLTGTFGGCLQNSNASRCYPFTYTISSANTWEKKTVTIAGDTTGTWVTDNGVGLQVFFNLGTGTTYSGAAGSWASSIYISATGATSVVGTNGATFYITGVQLEKGSTATSFDYRPYGTEFMLCQRYYQKAGTYYNGTWGSGLGGNSWVMWPFKVTMRAAPTMTNPSSSTLNGVGVDAVSYYDPGFYAQVFPNATANAEL